MPQGPRQGRQSSAFQRLRKALLLVPAAGLGLACLFAEPGKAFAIKARHKTFWEEVPDGVPPSAFFIEMRRRRIKAGWKSPKLTPPLEIVTEPAPTRVWRLPGGNGLPEKALLAAPPPPRPLAFLPLPRTSLATVVQNNRQLAEHSESQTTTIVALETLKQEISVAEPGSLASSCSNELVQTATAAFRIDRGLQLPAGQPLEAEKAEEAPPVKEEELGLQRQRLELLATEVGEGADLGQLSAQELSGALWSIAAFRLEVPSLQAELPRLADALLQVAGDLKADGVAKALWAVAELRNEAPLLEALLPSLVARLARTVLQLTPQEIATTVYACAALQTDLRSVGLRMSRIIQVLTGRLMKSGVQELPTQSLADLTWAVAMVPVFEEAMQELVPKIIDEASNRMDEIDPDTYYTLAWAAATLKATWKEDRTPGILRILHGALPRVISKLRPRQLSVVLWCFASLDPGGEASRQAIKASKEEVWVAMEEMTLMDLSYCMWAFAALNLRDEDFLSTAAEWILKTEVGVRPARLALALPRIVWACAKLDFRDQRLMHLFEERLKPEVYVLMHFTPEDLHAMIWAFRKFDPQRDRYAITLRDLEYKIKFFIAMRRSTRPYVDHDPDTPPPMRNQLMLEIAVAQGELGPDAQQERSRVTGRVKVQPIKTAEPMSKGLIVLRDNKPSRAYMPKNVRVQKGGAFGNA